MRPLMKLDEVALALNVSLNTARRWASEYPNKLPPRTRLPAKGWRCRPEDLEAWLSAYNGFDGFESQDQSKVEVEITTESLTTQEPDRPSAREFFRNHKNRLK